MPHHVICEYPTTARIILCDVLQAEDLRFLNDYNIGLVVCAYSWSKDTKPRPGWPRRPRYPVATGPEREGSRPSEGMGEGGERGEIRG